MQRTGLKQWFTQHVGTSHPRNHVEKDARAMVARQVGRSFLGALQPDALMMYLMHREDQAEARARYIRDERPLRRCDPQALKALEQDAALAFPDGREGVVVFRATVGPHSGCDHDSAAPDSAAHDAAVVARFISAQGMVYEPALVTLIQTEVDAVVKRRGLPFYVNKIDLRIKPLGDGPFVLEAVALLEPRVDTVTAKLDRFS